MPNSFPGFGKPNKVKEFVLKMDIHYDVQRSKMENKVFKADIFLSTMLFNSELAINCKSPKLW
jgi:hypothetical protein